MSPDEYRKLLRIGDNYFNTTTTLYRLGGATALGGFDAFLGSMSDSFLSRQLAARYGFAFIPEVLGYWRFHGQNYSVATVTDPAALEELLVSLRAALAREPSGVFPSDYDDTLDRRVRFAGVRLIAMDHHSLAGARGEQIAAILHGGGTRAPASCRPDVHGAARLDCSSRLADDAAAPVVALQPSGAVDDAPLDPVGKPSSMGRVCLTLQRRHRPRRSHQR